MSNDRGLGQQVLRAIAGSAGLRMVGIGFGFLVGVQLARGLGAEGYGVYGLAMSLVAILTVPVEFGLPQLVTREVAVAHVDRDWNKLVGVLQWARRASIYIALAMLIVVFVAVFALGLSLSSELVVTLLVGLLMVPLVAQGNISGAALRGLHKIVMGQLPQVVLRPMLFSGLLFVLSVCSISLSPPIAMVAGAIAAALAFLVAASLLRRTIQGEVVLATALEKGRDWWASAIPMALAEGMRVLQGHLVILILAVISTVSLVGIYKVAISVSLMIAVPITLFNIVNAPIVARLYKERDFPRLQKLMTWTALAMTLCTLFLILPFVFSGDHILGAVFGSDFSQSNSVLLILFFGVLASSIFGSNAILLNMTGHEARVTRASVISLLLLAIVSPALTHFQGIEGAAMASALTSLVWNVLLWRDCRRLVNINSSLTALLHWGTKE